MIEGNRTLAAFENAVSVYDTSLLSETEEVIIKKYFKGRKVLDVGCGVGRTTINLHNLGFDVVGIDYTKALIHKAKEKYPQVPFKHMNAKALQFPNASFDTVFFSYNGLDYLHPLQDRLKAIREASRVLKKRGVFVFSSHKKYYWNPPLRLSYPFINIHYLKTMLGSLRSKDNYRTERHQFGSLNTFFSNNSSAHALNNGFGRVIVLSGSSNNNYICYKGAE